MGIVGEDPKLVELLRSLVNMAPPEWGSLVVLLKDLEKIIQPEEARKATLRYIRRCLEGTEDSSKMLLYLSMMEFLEGPFYDTDGWDRYVYAICNILRLRRQN